MQLKVAVGPLRKTEVINLQNGRRMGVLTACEIDMDTGRILALCAGDAPLPFLPPRERVRIQWEAVRRVGADVVLVDCPEDTSPPEREPCIRF